MEQHEHGKWNGKASYIMEHNTCSFNPVWCRSVRFMVDANNRDYYCHLVVRNYALSFSLTLSLFTQIHFYSNEDNFIGCRCNRLRFLSFSSQLDCHHAFTWIESLNKRAATAIKENKTADRSLGKSFFFVAVDFLKSAFNFINFNRINSHWNAILLMI